MVFITQTARGYCVLDENSLILRTLDTYREADAWAIDADDEYRKSKNR